MTKWAIYMNYLGSDTVVATFDTEDDAIAGMHKLHQDPRYMRSFNLVVDTFDTPPHNPSGYELRGILYD